MSKLVSLMTLLASSAFFLSWELGGEAPNNAIPNQTRIAWSVPELTVTVSPGSKVSKTISFRSDQDLPGLVVWISPPLGSVVSAVPSTFASIKANQTYQLSFSISVPSVTQQRLFRGTVHLLDFDGTQRTFAEPLPVRLSTLLPPTCTITANPPTIDSGQSSTLSWTTTGDPKKSIIDNGVGAAAESGGSTFVSPVATATYNLTVSNAAGIGVCSVPVTVNQLPAKLFLFTSLQPGFTQEVFGVATLRPGSFVSAAFAPNADVWVSSCITGGAINRFVRAQTTVIDGLFVHPQAPGSPFPSDPGCGIVNHPDGSIYANSAGVVRLDPNTGAPKGARFGPVGAHGIVVDPQSNHLVYVGDCYPAPCNIYDIDPETHAVRTFATLPSASMVNGIAFDPSGNFLLVASLGATIKINGVTTYVPVVFVLDRNGAVIQEIVAQNDGGPVGVGFHATSPQFALISNRFGSITRLDFPGQNLRLPPVQSEFAKRARTSTILDGALLSVGPDSCLYVPVGVSFNQSPYPPNALLRICELHPGRGF